MPPVALPPVARFPPIPPAPPKADTTPPVATTPPVPTLPPTDEPPLVFAAELPPRPVFPPTPAAPPVPSCPPTLLADAGVSAPPQPTMVLSATTAKRDCQLQFWKCFGTDGFIAFSSSLRARQSSPTALRPQVTATSGVRFMTCAIRHRTIVIGVVRRNLEQDAVVGPILHVGRKGGLIRAQSNQHLGRGAEHRWCSDYYRHLPS